MGNQLYKKENGEFKEIFPLNFIQNIKDKNTQKTLFSILSTFNNIFVTYNESKENTRNQIPQWIRRTGLWITYKYNEEYITEKFKGSYEDIVDNWSNDNNWDIVPDINFVQNESSKLPDGIITFEKLSPELQQLLNAENTIINLPDNEDIEVVNSVLKFKNKKYNKTLASGLGKKYLRKNWTNIGTKTINVLTQEMINEPNTIYIIQYDYDLNGKEITILENCILQFEGGSFNNGVLKGENTRIKSENICFKNCTFGGNFNGDSHAKWFCHPMLTSGVYVGMKDDSYILADGFVPYDCREGLTQSMNLALSSSGWLDLDGNQYYIIGGIIMQQYNWAHLKNGKILFQPTKDKEFAIKYEYALNACIDTVNILCCNGDSLYKGCGAIWFTKTATNTSDWFFRKMKVLGFNGYVIVNNSYLQEGCLEQINCRYVGGFLSYDCDTIYGEYMGSSNIIRISDCTIDLGINKKAHIDYTPSVIDLNAPGIIKFEKMVLQGRGVDNIKGMTVRGGYYMPLTPNIDMEIWFEFVNGDELNKVYIESPSKIVLRYMCDITINCDNCLVDYNSIMHNQISNDFFYGLHINENVAKIEIIADKANQQPYQFFYSQYLSWLKKGWVKYINQKIIPIKTNSNLGSASYNINYSLNMNYLRLAFSGDVYALSPGDSKYLDVNGIPVLEYSYSGDTIRYVQLTNIPREEQSGSVSYVIYRYKSTTNKDGILNINSLFVDITTTSTEWSEWKIQLIGSPSSAGFGFVMNVQNATVQFAVIQSSRVNALITDEIYINNGELIKNYDYIPIITLKDKAFLTSNLHIAKECKSALFKVDNELYQADGNGDMINIRTGEGILKIKKGLSTKRPTLTSTDDGFEYYDTTLKKKILWNGTDWVNLDGSVL